MRAKIRAHSWRMLSAAALWLLRRQIADASTRGQYVRLDGLIQQYREMQTAHADLCEELQHLRAGR